MPKSGQGDRTAPQTANYHHLASTSEQAMATIPGGKTFAGTNTPVLANDGEGPQRPAYLQRYKIAVTTTTNSLFAAFVKATGYVTQAEREGASVVFASQVAPGACDKGGVLGTPWWRIVEGACWRYPGGGRDGPSSAEHPVVHVSWYDAQAYCGWAGGRLPTEVEWEHAAHGGLGDVRYPWGNDDPPTSGARRCNIWHGQFPQHEGIAPGLVPAEYFSPNGYGLYNTCGNVWEWTTDRFSNRVSACSERRVLKGGSFICHISYCYRYRIAARIGVSPDMATSHQGFRLVKQAV